MEYLGDMLVSSPSRICRVLVCAGLLLSGCTKQHAEQSAPAGSGGSEAKEPVSTLEPAGKPLDAAVLAERLGVAVTAMEGSLVLTRAELSPVLGALRRANLHLSALSPDGAGQPLAHFWVYFRGRGSSLELVRALRGVLDARVAPR